MTSIQSLCFQFKYVPSDQIPPFRKLKTLSDITKKSNGFIPADLNDDKNEDGESFYKFDISCFHELFNAYDYSSSILIWPSIEEIHIINSETKVVIVVGVETPRTGTETINLVDYELPVICVMKANRKLTKNLNLMPWNICVTGMEIILGENMK